MKRFVETIAAAMKKNYRDTKQIKLSKAKNIVLIGTSSYTVKVMKELASYSLDIFICDFEKENWGKNFEGKKVLSPTEVVGLSIQDMLAGITVGRGAVVIEKLAIMGIQNYIDFTVEAEPLHLPHYQHDLIIKNLDGLLQTYNWLEDEASKEKMLSIFTYRITGDAAFLPEMDPASYFHLLVRPRVNDVIIDGGAFIGDTAIPFARFLKNQCKIYSFEPGDGNYDKLVTNVQENELNDICFPIKAGLWDEDCVLKINSESGKGVHVVDEGISINAVSVDNFIRSERISPNLIKLDVEGAEEKVLLGAVETIYRFRPSLQVCLYHKADDFWVIPQLIKQIEPNYRFFFSHHDNRLCESVLYALYSPVR